MVMHYNNGREEKLIRNVAVITVYSRDEPVSIILEDGTKRTVNTNGIQGGTINVFDRNAWNDYNNKWRKLEPLKPCPCCGGEAWLEDNSDYYPKDCLVECRSCGLSTKLMRSPEDAIALWNQRVKAD